MRLYEILDEMENCIDAETGEVDTDKLTALQEERDTKLEGVGLWVLDLQSDIAKIKAEKNRLDERQKACERKIESLKNWLAYALAGEKLKTEKVTIGYRTSKSVIIDNIENVPAEFVKTETVKTADKAALKEAFKEWTLIDGCHLETNTKVQVH